MKSFCFKTNNTQILNYLLNRIQEIDFENLIYSQNQFKIYKNITIHYRGNNNNKFYNFLTELIGEEKADNTITCPHCGKKIKIEKGE